MKNFFITCAAGAITTLLYGCGGSSDSPPPPPPLTRFVAPEGGSFVAAVDPTNLASLVAPALGTYAGKQLLHSGTANSATQTYSNYAGSTLVYKGANGGIFKMDLLTATAPAPVPLSNESTATIDDACSYSPGPDLAGTFSASDFVNPANSAYFYRLPGPDGLCGTGDDVVRMVKLGMSAIDTPINALMPIGVARGADGSINGYVAVQGATLSLFDANFANARVLYTAPAPIVKAFRLPLFGIAQSGGFFDIDGNLIYADYVAGTSTAPLFTFARAAERPVAAAGPGALYFVDVVETGSGAAATTTSTIYTVPANASAAPTAATTEPARVAAMQWPAGASSLIYATAPAGGQYTIKALSSATNTASTVLVTSGNTGSFTAVGNNVYYTSFQVSEPAAKTRVFSDARSGVVRNDGTNVVPEQLNSRFAGGTERDDNQFVTRLFRVRGLAPVTAVLANGDTVTDQGVAGGTLESIDISTNVIGAALGVVPTASMAFLDIPLVGDAGFAFGSTRLSTGNPLTRELLYLNAAQPGSLQRLTSSLP